MDSCFNVTCLTYFPSLYLVVKCRKHILSDIYALNQITDEERRNVNRYANYCQNKFALEKNLIILFENLVDSINMSVQK